VVFAGPAGVGKTRLALEGLELAERAGLATVRVTGTRSGASLPFGALAPLLPAADQREPGAADDRSDLLRRSASALLGLAGGRRLALLADDAHLLDDSSATVIHQLAVTNGAFTLATVRTGEPAPDSVVALWKDGLVERVELVGLRTKQIEELLQAVLGGPVDPAAAARLAVRCQGNVLFLRELVLAAIDTGALRDEGGIWRIVGRTSPSDRLVELVEARLSGLTDAERDLLELVSFGEPLGPAELSALGDLELAESLERKGLLAPWRDQRRLTIRLGHPLYGEVLRARMPILRTSGLARSLAETVEATGARRREDVLRVATWRLEAGGGADPELMLAAARTARWRYDFPLAERLARAAVDAGAGFEADLLAAQLTSLQGRGSQAEAELADLTGRVTNDAERSLVAIARLDNSAFYLGRISEGIRIAEEAEATIVDPAWRDEVTARRAAFLIATDGLRVAAEAAEPLLRRGKGAGLVFACQVAAYSLGRLGRLDGAIEAANRGYTAHRTLPEPLDWYPSVHVFLRSEALAHAGRFQEAEASAREEYDRGVVEGSTETQAWLAFHLGKVVGDRGHVESAIRHLREAVALFRDLDRPQFLGWCLPYLALALALGGRTDEAVDTLDILDALGLPMLWVATDTWQSRAWTAVAAGDLHRARELLEEAARTGARTEDLVGEAAALHGLARLGRAKEVVCRLEEVAGQIEGVLAPARLDHVRALAQADPQRLSGASSAFEAMGADLLAAEAAADAAVAWRRSGESRQAAAAERLAGALAARCQGAATPALQAIEARAILTRSEQEAALLAAAGHSNKQIAAELFLSVRTVETRLQRVYEKLGVSSRTALADVLKTVTTDRR
jgi:DNA-binding CsgD family transcriptional regulator